MGSCSFPGIKFAYGPDEYFGKEVSVLEMDGKFDNLQELIYVESHLSATGTKFYGELTQNMLKHADAPGSDNGTGFSRRSRRSRSARCTRTSRARRSTSRCPRRRKARRRATPLRCRRSFCAARAPFPRAPR